MASILDVEFNDMDDNVQTLRSLGTEDTKKWLVVNVASACGLTKHYIGLQKVSEKDGVTVVGFPCNQFGSQEPGSHEEICDFTSDKYGVTFSLMAKIEVNGDNQAELFEQLTAVADLDDYTGPIRWNFEKFIIDLEGKISRYAPQILAEEIV
tara:strand:+ start:469 stop:924 length:456 start_codon:yes stop_codon:yes gene_type:complete